MAPAVDRSALSNINRLSAMAYKIECAHLRSLLLCQLHALNSMLLDGIDAPVVDNVFDQLLNLNEPRPEVREHRTLYLHVCSFAGVLVGIVMVLRGQLSQKKDVSEFIQDIVKIKEDLEANKTYLSEYINEFNKRLIALIVKGQKAITRLDIETLQSFIAQTESKDTIKYDDERATIIYSMHRYFTEIIKNWQEGKFPSPPLASSGRSIGRTGIVNNAGTIVQAAPVHARRAGRVAIDDKRYKQYEKPTKCEQCDSVFKGTHGVNKHRMMHKKIRCQHCRIFIGAKNFKSHVSACLDEAAEARENVHPKTGATKRK